MAASFFPTANLRFYSIWSFIHFFPLLSTIHLAVSAAVVLSTFKKHRTLGPEPAVLFFLSKSRSLPKNLPAFSPFWKYFSTAPSKPRGPFFGEMHPSCFAVHSLFHFSHLTGERFPILLEKKHVNGHRGSKCLSEISCFFVLKYTPEGLSGRQRP